MHLCIHSIQGSVHTQRWRQHAQALLVNGPRESKVQTGHRGGGGGGGFGGMGWWGGGRCDEVNIEHKKVHT